MQFSDFTMYVTEDCNFDCSYCYQKKEQKYIDLPTIERAVDFFLPYLTNSCYVNLYGGEPLLAFDRIRHAVHYLREKNALQKKEIKYSITTNGSLLDDEMLQFFDRFKFSLLLSFDGLAQEKYRKNDSFAPIVSNIKKTLEYPDIDLETNSVFTPETVGDLSRSIRFLIDLGVPNVGISLTQHSPWKASSLHLLREELTSLVDFCSSEYEMSRVVRVVNFRKNSQKGIFTCYAGRDRMAMSSEGDLWGCHLFLDRFKLEPGKQAHDRYYFGSLDSFIANHEKVYPKILSNYSGLRMNRFFTSEKGCHQCEEIEECPVCPLDNLLSGKEIRQISLWTCETTRIMRAMRRQFWDTVG